MNMNNLKKVITSPTQKNLLRFYAMYLKGSTTNPMEPNESPVHNYFKYILPTFAHFYLAGVLFSNITNVVPEPYYNDYAKGVNNFPYKKNRADLAFEFNGKTYLIEFMYGNKDILKKIKMAKKYGFNLIVIDASGFYSKMRQLRKEGKELEILMEFDTFIRNLLMKQNNHSLVDVYENA